MAQLVFIPFSGSGGGGGSPTGPAGGNLGGTYPNPVVVKIQNSPVSAVAPTANQVLFWNGALWVPTTLPSADVSYNDALVPVPSLGVNEVQAAIDVLKVQVAALVPGSYRRSFTNADLVGINGILTVVHNLGVRFNTWAIYDNNNSAVLNPDSAIDINGNTLAFGLATYQQVNGGSIPGTWDVVVQS